MIGKKLNAKPFYFKKFVIEQDQCPMKIGTDGVLLGAWANVEGRKKILDIGTGTGVIAIMLAQRNMEADIEAVEIDTIASKQAASNMKNSPWSNRLKVSNMSIQNFSRSSSTKYDLIVSNPPFFSGGTFSENENRNIVRHTIKLPSGELLNAVRNLLSDDGRFSLILPFIEGLRFIEMAKQYHLYCSHIVEVKPKLEKGIKRLLLNFEKKQKEVITEQLVIQHLNRNDYTNDYIQLTNSFYLNM